MRSVLKMPFAGLLAHVVVDGKHKARGQLTQRCPCTREGGAVREELEGAHLFEVLDGPGGLLADVTGDVGVLGSSYVACYTLEHCGVVSLRLCLSSKMR